jgi:hypothetical protein
MPFLRAVAPSLAARGIPRFSRAPTLLDRGSFSERTWKLFSLCADLPGSVSFLAGPGLFPIAHYGFPICCF